MSFAASARSLALILAFSLLCRATEAGPPTASATIAGFYDVLMTVMTKGSSLGFDGRYRVLEPAIEGTFDLPFMTRVAVGPSWATLSSGTRQDLIVAFSRYTIATYASQFDAYTGQAFRVVAESSRNGDMLATTEIVKANGTVTIDYLLHHVDGGWRVVDVYLDGSISQLAIRRSEFGSIIQQHGATGLIAVLSEKVGALRTERR